ncbi:MAG: hypothetical protein JW951_08125 [Lentisphaerae bacterium]|nr:hypothetical protein [Lentisphaerota bacterium]
MNAWKRTGKRGRRVSGPEKPPAETEAQGAGGRLRRKAPLAALLVFVAAVFVLALPRFYLPGDNYTMRAEAIQFVNTGRIGIPFARRAELAGFTQDRGQYFYENEDKAELFPKYGIGYTVLYVPPVWLARLCRGGEPLALVENSDALLLFLCLENTLLALIAVAYLYLIVALYTQREAWRIGFVLASVFATFAWYHLRKPAHDSFQVFPFVGFSYHALMFLRQAREGAGGRGRWGHLAAASGWAGFLTWMRLSYLSLYAPLGLFAVLAGGPSGGSWFRTAWGNVRMHWRAYLLALIVPAAVFLGVLLWSQYYRFGSPLNSGYGQWVREGKPLVSARYIGRSLYRYFVELNNFNVFTHYPLFLLAVLGAWRFARRRPFEACFLAGVFVFYLMPLLIVRSLGSWCYGPRYVLPVLMVCSVPCVEAWDFLTRPVSGAAGKAGLVVKAGILVVLLGSVRLQYNMNALHGFTYFYVRGLCRQLPEPLVTSGRGRYPAGYFHRGLIHGHLIAYREGKGGLPFMAQARRLMPPEQYRRFEAQIQPHLLRMAQPNFYFFE